MLARLERSTQLRPRRQQLEQQDEQQQEQQDEQQQTARTPATSHGPGFCVCCRPLNTGEPVTQVITYVDGVVLEVETADGDVVVFEEEGSDAYGASYLPYEPGSPQSSAPLVYVPDMVIPPPAPAVEES
jgi:hypothetical protein